MVQSRLPPEEHIIQWRFYIGAMGAKPQIPKKEGFSPPNFKVGTYFFRWSGRLTLTELTGSAVDTHEAITSVKFVASVKI